jgi:hypothetical protein
MRIKSVVDFEIKYLLFFMPTDEMPVFNLTLKAFSNEAYGFNHR